MKVNQIRRTFSALLAATTAGVLLFMPLVSQAQDSSKVVVFAGWGGSIEAAQRKVFFNSFEKETGIKVIDVPDVQLPKIKAMVETGDTKWDVVQALGMWIPQGAQGNLWEPLDFNVIRREGVPPALVDKFSIGNSTYGIILAYNSKVTGANPPSSWANYWDLAGHPGRRGMFDGPRYTLEAALLADGVEPSKLYPLDVDRAFRSLDKIKDGVNVWWKQWPQPPVLLASQELSMSLTSNTRIASVRKEEKVPLDIVWKGGLMTVDFLAVPRGAKNRANAMKLIQWMNDPQRQAELSKMTGIGPGNTNAFAHLAEAEKQDLASYHYQKGEMVLFDNAWWAQNEEALTQRWNAWKLR
jgi:putative spermidine/putrescine transport system substrate-binding protein